MNAWLEDRCVDRARHAAHPVLKDRTVWEVFETAERPALIAYRGPFDGFHSVPASVSKTLLVRFDYNEYSVHAAAARRRPRVPPMDYRGNPLPQSMGVNVRRRSGVNFARRLTAAGSLWGVSNLDADDMVELVAAGGTRCAADQILYNFTRSGPENDLML